MMTDRERLKSFFAADSDYIKLHDHELHAMLQRLQPHDVVGLDEHRQLIELIAALRRIIERNNELNGANFNATLKSLLSVGEDGLYSDPLRFLFELIQNVDDCDYDNRSAVKLRIKFKGQHIQLEYNERGFTPLNVFAITGIAEAAKNIDDSRIEIGEKGLGFKSVFGIAESVLIQSGCFAFRLHKDHFTVPIPEYRNYSPVKGTRFTLELRDSRDVDRICHLIKERYCKPNAIFRQNPMLFLNKLTELELLVNNAREQLLFYAERKSKQPISDCLAVENGVTVMASLKSLSAGKTEGDFCESIVCDRYTYSTTYTRSMCQARYEESTRLTRKLMTLQAIYPHEAYLDAANAIETGALYSFLPTQVTINAPIIVHAPFKLDGSREYVDSQDKNKWFQHTIDRLFDMLNESLTDMAKKVHENVLRYIPKRHMFIFSGNKSHSLRDTAYKGEMLLDRRIFWGVDRAFHSRNEIKAYGGNLTAAAQQRIYGILKGDYQLFVMPAGLKASDFGISTVDDPYRILIARALHDVKIMRQALNVLCDWLEHAQENELTSRLDAYMTDITKAVPRCTANTMEHKRTISLEQVKLIAQYPAFARPFCKWVQARLAASISDRPAADCPFEFAESYPTRDITNIDPDNSFELSDVGANMREYLQGIRCKCVFVPGDCICIPTNRVLLLSEQNRLDMFATFCRVMDKNSQFDITLRLMANSRKLNDAEEALTTDEFMQLLKDVRVNGKMALGRSYESYINLLHNAAASTVKFISELMQNADDCTYSDNVVPHMFIDVKGDTMVIHYNEAGFTKHNVRAITAIGESTKKQLLSAQSISREPIGEKGIGFKSVFAVASNVCIHSNGFHFGLRDTAPTVPILDIEKKYQGMQGTYMEITLKEPLPANLLSSEALLELCLCLRNIRQITCNNTDIKISDAAGSRNITVADATYKFDVYRHDFRITDKQALSERQHGGRVIAPEQSVYCYVPRSNRWKADYFLYSGLPTKIPVNIPMYIDAPFELTTSREFVIENAWNTIIRTHVYRAIYGFTNAAKDELLIRALRFVAVRQQVNAFQNNTFEANAFLNAVPLSEYARPNIHVPVISGRLRHASQTRKYPAFIRRMIAAAFIAGPEAETTLNYSDEEYNAAYIYLGGQIAKAEDILAVLKKADLQQMLKEDTFRRQLYSWCESEKRISAYMRTLSIVPVWDNTPDRVRFVPYNGRPIYIEHGKTVSESNEYWVLNEQLMSPTMFTAILGAPIETMDHERAVQLNKKKLLEAIRPLSAQTTYRYLSQEACTNPMIMEVLHTVTADEQRLFTLQNLDGDTVDCQHIFTLHPNQIGAVFGRMLRKYVASPECYALALALHCKPLEEIQLGDVEDYEDMLTSDDMEDLLMLNSPKILYGRTIAREFYENGQVKQEAAEEYGLVYVPAAVDTDSWPFPSNGLISLESLNSYMNEQLRAAPSLISGTVEKPVRGYYKNGRFCELDRMPSRQAQLANYTAANNGDFCFCQMCKKPKNKAFIEVASILQEPSRFLPQLYLALCLECSKRFQGLREAKKSDFSRELYDKIMAAPVHASGNVTIDMQDSFGLSLTFTETHLAEIQAVLPKLTGTANKAISETSSIADIPTSSAPAVAGGNRTLNQVHDSN